jgi:hypothetical protein
MVNATVQVPERILLICGLTLLAISALLGFVQHRYRGRPDLFARWRVVHNGGTAGAVQLLALGAVWGRLGRGPGGGGILLATGIALATIAFFLGPLAQALSWRRTAAVILTAGAVVAFPSYAALPILLVL